MTQKQTQRAARTRMGRRRQPQPTGVKAVLAALGTAAGGRRPAKRGRAAKGGLGAQLISALKRR